MQCSPVFAAGVTKAAHRVRSISLSVIVLLHGLAEVISSLLLKAIKASPVGEAVLPVRESAFSMLMLLKLAGIL